MGSLLLLALLARCAAAAEEGLAVALHAQAYPVEGGVIVGSVMTTNGLKRALLRSGRVRVARSFYPFHYSGIADEAWDLVIIEGWFEMSNAFIHEVRRLRPAVVVLYWCLDPHFPGLDAIGSLDVDGYLTNSATVAATLGNVAPAEVVNLAVDLDEMAPAAAEAPAGAPLVYVGSALGIETKANLVGILREAAASSLGLELWGAGWADVGPDDLKAHYRGILPHGALAACYGNASAVIGATMDGQRAAGMVNNRVFEALATGAPLVMETFPELEALFADLPEDGGASHLLLWREPGDVAKRVDALRRTADLVLRGARLLRDAPRARQRLRERGDLARAILKGMTRFPQSMTSRQSRTSPCRCAKWLALLMPKL